MSTIVKSLLKSWNENREAAAPRNELRKMAASEKMSLEDFIEKSFKTKENITRFLPKEDEEFPLRTLAKLMIAKGYRAEYMRDSEEAYVWIRMMADGKTNEHNMQPQAQLFWRAAETKFNYWLTVNEDE